MEREAREGGGGEGGDGKGGGKGEGGEGDSWMPNFGAVWQSGPRRDTRVAFDKGRKKERRVEEAHEPLSSLLQPYVSKRHKVGGTSEA